jgi:hypothetical protein
LYIVEKLLISLNVTIQTRNLWVARHSRFTPTKTSYFLFLIK